MLHTFCHPSCCDMLRYVATCWMMLDQIWKWSNFSGNILDVARCWTRLATFTQQCYNRACALGPLVARQGPGARRHRQMNFKNACFGFQIFRALPSWIIMTCRGCPIVPEQSLLVSEQKGNHDTSQLFKMAAPGKFESQNKRFWN